MTLLIGIGSIPIYHGSTSEPGDTVRTQPPSLTPNGKFIAAGLAVVDRVEKRREAKREKRRMDELRYQELQRETKLRNEGRRASSESLRSEDGDTPQASTAGSKKKIERAPPSYDEAVRSKSQQTSTSRAE